MPDMRDELVERSFHAHTTWAQNDGDTRSVEAVILDSIPPGSYKRKDGTWVRLKAKKQRRHHFDCGWPDSSCNQFCRDVAILYTEVDHAE